jgi:hypothetical protein
VNVTFDRTAAWQRITRAFREHPVRSTFRLAVIIYVAGLIITLLFGLFFHHPEPMIFREP